MKIAEAWAARLNVRPKLSRLRASVRSTNLGAIAA